MKRVFAIAALLVLSVAPALGQQAGCLLYADDTPPRAVAEVAVPEGFACLPEEPPAGETPEYYFLPTDTDSHVRFLYYTTGRGDARRLAEAALSSYRMLYDEFDTGEIRSEDFAGRACLYFDYTCAYPSRAGDTFVYEQTAVAYIPLNSDEFIACIASLAFDDPAGYLSTSSMREFLDFAMSAIKLFE